MMIHNESITMIVLLTIIIKIDISRYGHDDNETSEIGKTHENHFSEHRREMRQSTHNGHHKCMLNDWLTKMITLLNQSNRPSTCNTKVEDRRSEGGKHTDVGCDGTLCI
jgi:hypothetical protein